MLVDAKTVRPSSGGITAELSNLPLLNEVVTVTAVVTNPTHTYAEKVVKFYLEEPQNTKRNTTRHGPL